MNCLLERLLLLIMLICVIGLLMLGCQTVEIMIESEVYECGEGESVLVVTGECD